MSPTRKMTSTSLQRIRTSYLSIRKREDTCLQVDLESSIARLIRWSNDLASQRSKQEQGCRRRQSLHQIVMQLDSYDKTIRRTSSMYKNAALHQQALKHLRQHRNRSVHAGTQGGDFEVQVYQLKEYVAHLLRFHISNRFKFSSLSEGCGFMDISRDKSTLHKQIALLNDGLKFLG